MKSTPDAQLRALERGTQVRLILETLEAVERTRTNDLVTTTFPSMITRPNEQRAHTTTTVNSGRCT